MTKSWMRAAVLALAVAGAAAPGLADPYHPNISHRSDRVVGFYPERAQRTGAQGQALISCGVDSAARLTNCQILDEQPAGQDFGAAALKLAANDMENPPVGTRAQADGYHVMITFCQNPTSIWPTFPPSGPEPPCIK